jgi:hypothetical protein
MDIAGMDRHRTGAYGSPTRGKAMVCTFKTLTDISLCMTGETYHKQAQQHHKKNIFTLHTNIQILPYFYKEI